VINWRRVLVIHVDILNSDILDYVRACAGHGAPRVIILHWRLRSKLLLLLLKQIYCMVERYLRLLLLFIIFNIICHEIVD